MRLRSCFLTLHGLLFSFYLVSGQTPGVISSQGESADPNTLPGLPSPPSSIASPLYFYPNFPTYAQILADGGCQSVACAQTASAEGTFTIPATYPNCGLVGYAWMYYQYSGQNNCAPFSWTITLSEQGGGNIPEDPATGVFPVSPGKTYVLHVTVSTSSASCCINKVCPAPTLIKTDYSIENVSGTNAPVIINKFDSNNNSKKKRLLNILTCNLRQINLKLNKI